jgi:predicted amidohydrolase YtcJ
LVLSGDLMTCPEKDILNLQVLLTMVNGQIVYQREELP